MTRRLDDLRALSDDWDDDGAVAPTEEAVGLAEEIINSEPKVVALTNGGVQVEWRTAGADIEVRITPDGALEL